MLRAAVGLAAGAPPQLWEVGRGRRGWCCEEGTRQWEEQRWSEVDDDLHEVANGTGCTLVLTSDRLPFLSFLLLSWLLILFVFVRKNANRTC
jgi:hypothetical protein